MQAIQTKYFGPTNHNGSRIKATAAAGSVTVDYDHALNVGDNHKAAAAALVAKLGWGTTPINALRLSWVDGFLKDGTMVHVPAPAPVAVARRWAAKIQAA